MKIRNIALALAAVSMAATPAIAQSSVERSTAPVEGESEIQGASGILIALLAAAAAITGIIVVSSSDDDQPASP